MEFKKIQFLESLNLEEGRRERRRERKERERGKEYVCINVTPDHSMISKTWEVQNPVSEDRISSQT
jgi:hypothetical protein